MSNVIDFQQYREKKLIKTTQPYPLADVSEETQKRLENIRASIQRINALMDEMNKLNGKGQ
jgi:hypothetical protein